MYAGRVVEEIPGEAVLAAPRHPYTQALLAAAPIPDPVREKSRQRVRLDGEPPSPLDPRAPLRFLPSKLAVEPPYVPKLIEVDPGHLVSEFDPA
jgi:oligopeptide/dipeptide ABC transporter ATP-binding protein